MDTGEASLPPVGSAAAASAEDHHRTEDEAEVVPPAVVVHLVDVQLVAEERDDLRGRASSPAS